MENGFPKVEDYFPEMENEDLIPSEQDFSKLKDFLLINAFILAMYVFIEQIEINTVRIKVDDFNQNVLDRTRLFSEKSHLH